jgi:hypothetical protein
VVFEEIHLLAGGDVEDVDAAAVFFSEGDKTFRGHQGGFFVTPDRMRGWIAGDAEVHARL